jgi:hypothetical protein
MLFDKVRKYSPSENSREDSKKPLACMIFLFASQMSQNLEETGDTTTDSFNGPVSNGKRTHRLDTLLSEVQKHAHQSPHVTRFEAIPVEMAPSGLPRGTTREEMHDTLLLASFKNKWAWEQWIQTSEWQEFMKKTEDQGVFRRIPHVRCANSLKGLRSPLEILRA